MNTERTIDDSIGLDLSASWAPRRIRG